VNLFKIVPFKPEIFKLPVWKRVINFLQIAFFLRRQKMRVDKRLFFILITLYLPIAINLGGVASGTANAIDFLGYEVGNKYTYHGVYQQGSYNLVDEVIRIDRTTFSIPT
jgi:hypothetical protein